MKRVIAAIFSLAFAVACDRKGKPIEEFGLDKLAKGISGESDVRMVMGQPGTIFEEEDGTRILEYPKGPEGARTWMFRIGPDGKLDDYHQALTEENFAKVQPGMTKGEVRWILGKPRRIVRLNNLKEDVWDWRYLSVNPAVRLFNVHFDTTTDRVKRTTSTDEMDKLGG